MANQRNKLINSNTTWNALSRYKVNSVVEYNFIQWQNVTGFNSIPGSSLDWVPVFEPKYFSSYFMVENAVNTVFAAINTPIKILGNTTNLSLTSGFDNTQSNKSIYIGLNSGVFSVSATAFIDGDVSATKTMYLFKNGVKIENSKCVVKSDITTTERTYISQCLIDLVNGDYLEVYLENNTNTANALVLDLNVIIK